MCIARTGGCMDHAPCGGGGPGSGRWWVRVGGDSDAGDRWGPTATPTAADRLTAVRARGAGGGAERQRAEPGMVKPTERETQTEQRPGRGNRTGATRGRANHTSSLLDRAREDLHIVYGDFSVLFITSPSPCCGTRPIAPSEAIVVSRPEIRRDVIDPRRASK